MAAAPGEYPRNFGIAGSAVPHGHHEAYARPVLAEVARDTRREVEDLRSVVITLADAVSKLTATVANLRSIGKSRSQ